MNSFCRSASLCLLIATIVATSVSASDPASAVDATPPSSHTSTVEKKGVRATADGVAIVDSVSFSGADERVARISLTHGRAGQSAFALIQTTGAASDQVRFDSAGRATVTIGVTPGSTSLVEFHVFPAPGETGVPFVFDTIVADRPGTTFSPRISGITFSGTPRVARFEVTGLNPKIAVRGDNVTTGAVGAPLSADAFGTAFIPVQLRPGSSNEIVLALGTAPNLTRLTVHLDGDQDESPDPTLEIPVVAVTDGPTSGTLTIDIADRPQATATLADRSGAIAGTSLDDSGRGTIVIRRPPSEKPVSVLTDAMNGGKRRAVFILSEGVGSDLPSAPLVRESARTGGRVVLEVSGEPGTTAIVTRDDSATTPLAVTRIGDSGKTQLRVPVPATATTFAVHLTRGDGRSRPTLLTLAP